MTTGQKTIKFVAFAIAISLIAGILRVFVGGVIFVGSIFDIESKNLETVNFNININDYDSIEISSKVGSLVIKDGERFEVRSNSSSLTTETEGKVIRIKEENDYKFLSKIRLEVTIPNIFLQTLI